jgi:hypothetical protein
MRTLIFLWMTMLLAVSAMGQGLSVTESPKKPGDIIRYTINFEKAVGDTVSLVYLTFHLTTDPHGDQKGLPSTFDVTKFNQKSPTEYEVEGTIPNAMSGTYLLGSVQVRTSGGGIRNYAYPTDFAQENKIRVENAAKDIFPNIKSVTPSH